ncbi:MAG: radical SAM protein [Bacteroidales bacterium]|nr:radical SAM protein [Bacteroidales bacterium]
MSNRAFEILNRLFQWNETRVHELNYLFWECTTRCNLHCIHCGSDCTASGGEPDMPAEDFLRAFDTIPREERGQRFTVVMTGGEPLLRPDLPEIGIQLRNRGVGWSIVSNGYFYDEAMHRRLMGGGLGALTISLDGIGDEHDWMRGREGCYQRTIKAIAIAAKEQRINFDVVTCVNQRNLQQLQEIHDILAGLGVKQWRLFTIIPIGRACDHAELHLSDAQLVELMEFIKEKREYATQVLKHSGSQTIMNVTFSCEGYLGPYERMVRQNPFFCHAGINIASVLIDGTICACPNIDRKVFGQGNIYKDNLREVWQHGFAQFRDRSWTLRGKCSECEVAKKCHGGGMHNWHGDCKESISCHYMKLVKGKQAGR